MLVRLCSKFFKLDFRSMWTKNFQMCTSGFRKGRGTRNQIANTHWIREKAREFQKNIYFCFIDYTMEIRTNYGITTNYGKFFKKWEYETNVPVSWKTCIQVKKQKLESDMKQWTGSKLGKEYIKAVYCHPAYLTSMQSTSCEMPGWMNHKLDLRLPEEISTTSDMQIISL